jgi:hypothetical protein
MIKKLILTWLFLAGAGFLPRLVLADYGYFTMPLAASDTNGISSWFDHTSPQGAGDTSSTMTRFTGVQYFGAAAALSTSTSNPTSTCSDFNNSFGCYNGHEGIDFRTLGVTGKSILAAASGTVRQAQWYDPAHTSTGFGYFVRIWHSQYNLSTLYAHLDATSSAGIVVVGSTVTRGQKIAVSGCTGVCGGPHLHFQIYNADLTVNTSTGSHFDHGIDPYGWSGAGLDPWTNDIGYLWASSFATSSYINNYPNNLTITTSTTWSHDQTYVIPDTLTVSSSATLTIQQGVVVKCSSATATCIDVQGKLNITGTAADPVYITSLKDDSVGGDANDDATATSPAAGDWADISLDAKSTTTIQNAIIRYGGANNSPAFANVFMNGGYLSATSTTFASSSDHGFQFASGTALIASLADGFPDGIDYTQRCQLRCRRDHDREGTFDGWM